MCSWVNYCRCCLSSNCELSLIYGEQNIYEKFFETTSIQVKEDDGLPQKLCNVCYNIMISAHQFREQCIRIDTELKHLLNNLLINKPHLIEDSTDDNAANNPVNEIKDNEENNKRLDDNYLVLANENEYVVLLIDNLENNNTLTQLKSNDNIFQAQTKDFVENVLNFKNYAPTGVPPDFRSEIKENPANIHQENVILQSSLEQSEAVEKNKPIKCDELFTSLINDSENKSEQVHIQNALSETDIEGFINTSANYNDATVTNFPVDESGKEKESLSKVQQESEQEKDHENTFLKELEVIEKKESADIDKRFVSVIYNLIDELEQVLVEDKIIETKAEDSLYTNVNYDKTLTANKTILTQNNEDRNPTDLQHENAIIWHQGNSFINQFEAIEKRESTTEADNCFVSFINDVASKPEEVKIENNIFDTEVSDSIDVGVNSMNTVSPNVPGVRRVFEEDLAEVQRENTSFKQLESIDKKEQVESNECLISLLFDLNNNPEQVQVKDEVSEPKVEYFNTLPYDNSALITNGEKAPNNFQEQILQQNVKTTSIKGNDEWAKDNMSDYYNKHNLADKLLCNLCRKPYDSIDILIGHILSNIKTNDFLNINTNSGVDFSNINFDKYPLKQFEAIEESKSLEDDEYFVFIIEDPKDKLKEVQNEDKICNTELVDPIDALVDAPVKCDNTILDNVPIVNPDKKEESLTKVHQESAKILQNGAEKTLLKDTPGKKYDINDCDDKMCNVKPDFEVDANVEIKANDAEKQLEANDNNNNKSTERLLCNICRKTYNSLELLTGHMLLHINPKMLITCPLCSKSVRREAITLHIKYNHSNSPKCEICFKIFDNQQQLSRHKLVHRKKEYKCDICSKYFCSKHSMQAHTQTHSHQYLSNEHKKTIKCKTAAVEHKKLNDCSTLQHKRLNKREMITKLLSHTCPMCNQKFSALTDVEKHIKSCEYGKVICEQNTDSPDHNDPGTKIIFRCKICSKTFPSYAQLLLHKHVHKNERPFPCHLCSVKLKSRTELRSHLLKHKNQKKYGCSICMKVFTLKSNLLVHMRIHAFENA